MADLTKDKAVVGGALLENAIETSWDDAGPLVTPQELRELHLFGIPLYSFLQNPETGKRDKITDPLLKRYIIEAVGLAETEVGFEIFERQHEEGYAYDQAEQNSFGYSVLRHRPVQSVQEIAIVSTDNQVIWTVPLEWVDLAYAHQGQLAIFPFAVASQSGITIPVTSPVGLGLLPSLLRFSWIPRLWRCKFRTGFKDGHVPRTVNQLIGVIAAMEVLSMLATTRAHVTSSSMGIDGLSTSVSTPGPQLFNDRLQLLGEKRKWLTSKLKRYFGLGLFVNNV